MIAAASIVPPPPPAPTILWISSMNRMMSGLLRAESRILFSLSSKSPRNLVPATMAPISREIILLCSMHTGTFLSAMRMEMPSAIAVLPTPGSPTIRGLFFFLLHSMLMARSISLSLPITGSSTFSSAAAVRSYPNRSRISPSGSGTPSSGPSVSKSPYSLSPASGVSLAYRLILLKSNPRSWTMRENKDVPSLRMMLKNTMVSGMWPVSGIRDMEAAVSATCRSSGLTLMSSDTL